VALSANHTHCRHPVQLACRLTPSQAASEAAAAIPARSIADVHLTNGTVLRLQTAYDIRFGARPLRRWLEQHVVTELSRLIVAGELLDGGSVYIDVDT
jgi:C-terminal, D2-small domain, of ClpB protein